MKIYPANENGFPSFYAIDGVEVDEVLLKKSEAEALQPFGCTDRKTQVFKPCLGYALATYDREKVRTHKIQLNTKNHTWVYEELPARA